MCAPVRPNPSADALSAWSPARARGGSGFAPSHGLPDKQKTTVCVPFRTQNKNQVDSELIDALQGGHTTQEPGKFINTHVTQIQYKVRF